MTLKEVFEKAIKDGFTHAKDEYSHKGRKIQNWEKEIQEDKEYYEYNSMGFAMQINQFPSNFYVFWRK